VNLLAETKIGETGKLNFVFIEAYKENIFLFFKAVEEWSSYIVFIVRTMPSTFGPCIVHQYCVDGYMSHCGTFYTISSFLGI
jgi:hypothetical protein